MSERPSTLKALRESGYRSRTVKEELRENLVARLKTGEPLFPGVVGYDRTVIPALVNAVLAKHDFILLGLRGQGKSRILRSLSQYLDEYMPVISGSEINDDPLNPVSKYGQRMVQDCGDETPVEWVPRDARYREKLATPDVTISDLIGDIDPIKAATLKLTYADEEVIHFGIIPKTNRGIFAINELPDLSPRIQVGLLNIMEERDIQIRAFPVRLPLDILMVYSANPEDYTNRGNIITPLKDRIDTQIITHYPLEVETGMAITAQEAWTERGEDIEVPELFREIVEQAAFAARSNEFVDQSSGVSARMTIAALESLVSSIEKRSLTTGQPGMYPRIGDLWSLIPAITGKIELVYEGEQEGIVNVANRIIGKAVSDTFDRLLPDPYGDRGDDTRRRQREEDVVRDDPDDSPFHETINWFNSGNSLDLSDEHSQDDYRAALESVPGLADMAGTHFSPANDDERAMYMEFILEGLHQHSLIGREDVETGYTYRDMLQSMFDSF